MANHANLLSHYKARKQRNRRVGLDAYREHQLERRDWFQRQADVLMEKIRAEHAKGKSATDLIEQYLDMIAAARSYDKAMGNR